MPGHGTWQRVSLPSASHQALGKECFNFFLNFLFAECIHRSTRQRNNKKNLCRVPSKGHSAKYFKNKKNSLPSARSETLGKELKKKLNLCRVPDLGHSAKKLKTKKTNLCRVPNSRRSAKKDVAEHRYAGQPMPSAMLLPRAWHSAKKSFAESLFLPSAILC